MPSHRKKRLRFHESTQRALCRLVFLWLALMPVLGVATYSALFITPWYQNDQKERWQRRLSDNLGVDVQFRSIEFPSPNQIRVYDLVCANPETGREILKLAQANLAIDRSGWSVDVVSPELNGNQIQNAMRLVHDRLICHPQKSASLLRLSVPDLVVDDGATRLKFQNVEVGLKPTDSVSKLMVLFSLEGQKPNKPASFSVDRDHIDESTTWSLLSSDVVIPCRLLSEPFPSLKYLGSQASFEGKILWSQNKKTQSGDTLIQGTLHSVDLAMASSPFRNPLAGLGELGVKAEFIDDKLCTLQGTLKSQSCSLDTGWLDRISDSVKLHTGEANPTWRSFGRQALVNNMRVHFSLTPKGLVFAGASNPNELTVAAYVGSQARALIDNSVAPIALVTEAISAYSKPVQESPATRVAGR